MNPVGATLGSEHKLREKAGTRLVVVVSLRVMILQVVVGVVSLTFSSLHCLTVSIN